MDYKKIHDSLITKANFRKLENIPIEKHHIVPKCVGGSNEKTNIVELTPKEHFLAHKLLAKIYDCKGLRYAYNMMVFTTLNSKKKFSTKRDYKVSAREYEECRRFLSDDCSRRFKGSIYVNNGSIQKCVQKDQVEEFLKEG